MPEKGTDCVGSIGVLVEGSEGALLTIAAYIDLNPVRAGMVASPEDYRWCGYAEAVAGRRPARRC